MDMESHNTDVALACAGYIVIHHILKKKIEKKKRKSPRWWMTSVLKSRDLYSGTDLLNDLNKEDGANFSNFCRMNSSTFNQLLHMIAPSIEKQDTNYRKAIPPNERLAITLRYLATGDSYISLAYTFKVSKQTISRTIPEVCSAIIEVLKEYVKMPQSEEEWLTVAKSYEEKWNFPHCLGAIDGKHIQLQAPINSGSEYFNYKSTFSIVLMAIVDAEYNFLYADVGCQGRISDGGVLKNTTFYKCLENKTLMIPEPEHLSDSNVKMPYVFVADEAFQLKDNIMKPYSGAQEKGSIKRSFNYRLSRARRIVENAFGILSAIFRVLRKPMLLEPKNAELVVVACIYLHNFLRKKDNTFNNLFTYDQEEGGKIVDGNWRQENVQTASFTSLSRVGRKPARTAEDIRHEFAKYFFSERLPWQDIYE